MARLSGKVAIITGAAQGIGATFAKALAAEGASLSLCDLTEPKATVEAIKAAGGKAIGRVADVTRPISLIELVRATEQAFGAIHVLVNNAAMFGTLEQKRFHEIASEEWDQVMAVNARGPFECVKAVLPVMQRQRYGKIINIASGTVFKGQLGMLHYIASKGAVVAMTRALARELGDDGIAVNCLAPGLTASDNVVRNRASWQQSAVKTVASRCFKREELPEDLTGAVVFLSSSESDFMTGQTIVVDGGSVMH